MKYMADLSTEIVFKWLKIEENMIIKSDGRISKYPSREFLNAVVLNNHFDTDGLMSAWALLEPEKALKYENVMIAAAAAGDFEVKKCKILESMCPGLVLHTDGLGY